MMRRILIGLGILAAVVLVIFLEVDLHTREVFKAVRKFDANYSLDVRGNKHVSMTVTEFQPISLEDAPKLLKDKVYFYCVDASKQDSELIRVYSAKDFERVLFATKQREKIKCFQFGERKAVDQFSVPANYSGKVFIEEEKNFFRIEYYGWTHWHFNWWILDGKLLFSTEEYFDD